ncbi:hypothetical protein TIFTF001_029628 [Ficus carica]|uniref:Uncharacterized protein n=1 Tax=Ficus carica TaxID=3494 RepID=A0AA88DRY4_FICCA|nr:hypothetical protein TIFTF001_029628 [Ficus carica]
MDLTEEEDLVAVRTVGQPSKSDHRGHSRSVRINGILVYWMVDMKMFDRAEGRPIYTVNYFTSAVTPEYLDGVLPNWPTPAFSPLSQEGAPETKRCSHAAERQRLSDLDKFLCSLGKVLLRIVAIQRVPEPISNEDNPFINQAEYNWFGSSSTSGFPHDWSRLVRSEEEVTIVAPMPDPAIHYRARTVVTADVIGYVALFVVQRGVPTSLTSGLQSGCSSSRTWGPRITDEDVE